MHSQIILITPSYSQSFLDINFDPPNVTHPLTLDQIFSQLYVHAFSERFLINYVVFFQGMPLWAHDYVFWCGDFNYRINLSRDEVLELVQRREWSVLLQHDQLKVSISFICTLTLE